MNTLTTDLIPGSSVQSLLAAREACVTTALKIRQLQRELLALINKMLGDSFLEHFIEETIVKDVDPDKDERISLRIDAAFWKCLTNSVLLTNAMTHKARGEFIDTLEKGENKTPFTLPEIEKAAAHYFEQYGKTVEATIREVFAQVVNCHYRGKVKGSNRHVKQDNCRRIEASFRIRSLIAYRCFTGKYSVDYPSKWNGFRFSLDDLLTACHLAENGARPNYAKTFRAIAEPIFETGGDFVETEYFSVKCFKNGNQLVKWNKDKLGVLSEINRIGSGGAAEIAGPLRKRYKAEHFTEEGNYEN